MKNKNKGFTLVELVVSFVILLILASISVAGVLAYQDYADYNRQNNYAKTLFAAAQSELTAESVRGMLPALSEIPMDAVYLDTIITPSGKPASETDEGTSAKNGRVCTLLGTAEDYEKYLSGEYKDRSDDEARQKQALYDLFDDYLMDKGILKAAIALEFNADTGLVYAVLYSDRNTAFTYTAANKNGRVNICDRRDAYRREYLTGYYGVE